MMNKTTMVMLLMLLSTCLISQEDKNKFKWPDTPVAKVYQEFIKSYNTGNEEVIESFVKEWYQNTSDDYVFNKVDTWMDYYWRYGRIESHSITINKPHDLEIWLQGISTKAWFAVEFLLNEETGKVKGVGVLQGEIPEGIQMGSPSEADMLNKFNEYLNENEEAGLFQGSVILQKSGRPVLNRAYGFKDIEKGIKNSPNTRFDIMSITKLFTSLACMQLVQQGVLELDRTIDNYLPELPKHISEQITLRKILSHTSGYELDGIEGFRDELEKAQSMSEVLDLQLKYLPKWEHYESFKPNGRYDYANDSYDLAAIIIERVTGLKFEDYLKKYIFDIAGLQSTSFDDNEAALNYRYDLSAKGLVDFSSYYPYQISRISGAGGLVSTTEDLRLLFNALFKSNKLLDLVHRNLMFSPQIFESPAANIQMSPSFLSVDDKDIKAYNGYGLGVEVSYNGSLSVGHSGVSIGTNTNLKYFPDSDYLLIVLANNRSGASNVYNYFNSILPKK